MSYLIDTCAVSELAKRRPDQGLARWVDEVDERTIYLSVITLGELWKGIALLPESRRKAQLLEWVREDLTRRFDGRVLPVDEPVARRWGSILGEAERRGRKLPLLDALIGATAIVHGMKVVTRNTGDLKSTGAEVLNPWAA